MKIRFNGAAFVLLALAFAAASCANPSGNVVGGPPLVIPAGKGAITVTLPGNKAKALDVAFAAANSTYFEVVVYEETGNSTSGDRYWAVFEEGATSGTINGVNPGTYKVLVLAGLKVYNGAAAVPPEAFLFGTGLASGITVSTSSNTNVPVSLTNSTFSFSAITDGDPNVAGNQVALGQPFQFTVSGNTGTPVVVPSTNNFSLFNVAGTPNFTASAQEWSLTMGYTAPASVGTGTYHFGYSGGRLRILDAINGVTTGTTSDFDAVSYGDAVWRLPSSYDAKWVPFEAQVPGKVTVGFFSPGLDVEITWGAGQ